MWVINSGSELVEGKRLNLAIRIVVPCIECVVFPLLLSGFFNLWFQQLDYDTLGFLFGFCWISWTFKLILFIKFRKFPAIISSKPSFSLQFHPSLSGTPMTKILGLLTLSPDSWSSVHFGYFSGFLRFVCFFDLSSVHWLFLLISILLWSQSITFLFNFRNYTSQF